MEIKTIPQTGIGNHQLAIKYNAVQISIDFAK